MRQRSEVECPTDEMCVFTLTYPNPLPPPAPMLDPMDIITMTRSASWLQVQTQIIWVYNKAEVE